MTVSQYEYADRPWVLTDVPFRPNDDGKLVTGLRIPGIPQEEMAPGIVFSLSRADLDHIDFKLWLERGRVVPYVDEMVTDVGGDTVDTDYDDTFELAPDDELWAIDVIEDGDDG